MEQKHHCECNKKDEKIQLQADCQGKAQSRADEEAPAVGLQKSHEQEHGPGGEAKAGYCAIQKCAENEGAYNSGYNTICDIAESRLKANGKKMIEEVASLNNAYKQTKLEPMVAYAEFTTSQKALEEQEKVKKWLDVGFRVFKLDSSNMKDTYYKPADYSLNLLDQLDENIKPDRTPEDLLFQVMLDLGLMLDSKIEEKNINGKKVFVVGEYNDYVSPDLICCFDSNVDNNTVTEIAKMKPRFSVFRDSSMSRDSVAVNFDQIFETYSPSTTRKVL